MIAIILFLEFNRVNAEEINRDVIIKHEYDSSILLIPGEEVVLNFKIINNSGSDISITKIDIYNVLLSNFIDNDNNNRKSNDFLVDQKKEFVENLKITINQESIVLCKGSLLVESLKDYIFLKTNMKLKEVVFIHNNKFKEFSLKLSLGENVGNDFQQLKCNFDIKVCYEMDKSKADINGNLPEAGGKRTSYALRWLGVFIFLIGIVVFKFKFKNNRF